MCNELDKQLATNIVVAALNNNIFKLPNNVSHYASKQPAMTQYHKECAEQISVFYKEILNTIKSDSQ